ncbi:uncharacterized protein DNG_02636 [Cephalotrichum gorgonifer]|uniref:Uncharacterized protein n=1 Tax=Cephalotrichum gorgonifer TaxID=2041049 RepID=A0AAE8MST0_9PEZI|nr:uncharacterized protein DNG_02636 [Cephalotrichum gorgonifer]
MPGDACAERVGQVIIRFCLTGAAIFIESQVIPRRAAIIRQGRRLQNWLRLPEPLHIFSKTNPGMTDRDIRLGAAVVGISTLLNIIGLVIIVDSGHYGLRPSSG